MARDVGDWNLRVLKGESRVYTITVLRPIDSTDDPDDGLVDLTDSVLYFTVRTVEGASGDPVISKTSADVEQIEILDQTTNKGQFKVYLLSSDTNVAIKQYRYDVWVTFPDDDEARPVVRPSLFEVRPSVTVLP